jgi:hypothetical protein
MNKYSVRLGYSCTSYGNVTGVVYANSQEEAEELIYEGIDNIYDQDYDTNDSENYNYYEDEADIDLEESDVSGPHGNNNQTEQIPDYYLSEINLI